MPSVTLRAALLALLDRLPIRDDLLGRVRVDVAEHVRVAVHELVVHAARHVGQVELPLLVGQAGVEDDLEEQIAQLLLQMRVGVGVGAASASARSSAGQRVQDLVALLDQMGHERGVGLDRIPRAALAQRRHEIDQPGHLAPGGDGCRRGRSAGT